MSDIVIRAEGLGKSYQIGSSKPRYQTLRDTITNVALSPVRRLRAVAKGESARTDTETLWALKDVSFSVKRGEVVGIIGRNGAGKSTLLKILARVTKPSEGYLEMEGRIGSLLEVGTGFHPELTGRENTYLNGAILGMHRQEIARKFDEIIAFAEIEKFIDTPVKHYSSGMYMRLAFAVAAHLEPEILIVDEVLAVGDAAFQKKCLGKMGDVAKEGRTVLFVSHQMAAIQKLCETAILLDQGGIVASGDVNSVVDIYHRTIMQVESTDIIDVVINNIGQGIVKFTSWNVANSPTGGRYSCYSDEPCTLEFILVSRRIVEQADIGIVVWSSDGLLVWSMRSLDYGGSYVRLEEGEYKVQFSIPLFPVKEGVYQLHVGVNALSEGNLEDCHIQPALQVLVKNESGLSARWQGILNMRGEFKLSMADKMTN